MPGYAARVLHPQDAPPSLAERKRRLVRDQITDAGLRLIAARGFDAVTVEDVAHAAGVSRRTFFRYFASKEDVVVDFLGDLGGVLAATVRARPTDETWPDALEAACIEVLGHAVGDPPDKPRRIAALVLTHPGLRARYLARQDDWRDALAAELAARPGAGGTGPGRAVAAAGVAIVALDLGIRRWVDSGDVDPGPALRSAFADVRDPWS